MDEYGILNLIEETADVISEKHGMNVTYCESMDMDLFPVVVEVILDSYSEDELIERDVLGDLHFLAENGRLIPEEYKDASYQEIREYLLAHKEEILADIENDCKWYLGEHE
jgi:hypothetical protein